MPTYSTHTLLDRFLRYVRINTQANEKATTYPSSPGQRELGQLLCEELRGFGLTQAYQDAHGLVFATIPATVSEAPTIAWIAHLDTSPETSGQKVQPQVIHNYPGGDIVLPADPSKIIRVADCPELADLIGKTLITTDGTTLLGADDKAGVAVIMEACRILCEHPEIPHGAIRIVFTCDEEIGRGVLYLEPQQIDAVAGYTLDGTGVGEIEAETFSADLAIITIVGANIHPAIAKGRMINAIRLAAQYVERMPQRTYSPETTSERQGFLHPYVIEGGVAQVTMRCLLRDFDTDQLSEYAQWLREIGRQIEREYPGARVQIQIQPQYRNMREGIAREPRAVTYAVEAVRRAGLSPKLKSIRGGTDGALLTAKGLPTPNLSCGEHNFHSPLEWTCLQEMEAAVRVLLELAQVWAGH
jgi:tripeptide aminopeptidase